MARQLVRNGTTLFLALASVLGWTGCGDNVQPATRIRTHLTDTSTRAAASTSLRRGLMTSAAQTPPEVAALYLGSIDALALDYRPGQKVQTTGAADWSSWQVGTAVGQQLNRGAELTFDGTSSGMNADFVKEVGTFEIDLFALQIETPGVLIGDTYYMARTAESTVAAEDAYTSLAPVREMMQEDMPDNELGLADDGWGDVTVHSRWTIIFARSDWFPKPLTVLMDPWGPQDTWDGVARINWTSDPLTSDQRSLVESLYTQVLVDQWTDSVVMVVPFDGPVAVSVQKPSGDPTVISGTLDVSVNFDLAGILDASTNLVLSPAVLSFAGDGYGIPFGLALNMTANGRALAMLPPAPELDIIPTSTTAVTMQWRDNASYETGFEVQRGTGGVDGPFVTLYTAAALPGSGEVASTTATDIDPNQTYTWRVKALNGEVASYSNVTATKISDAPAAPSKLVAEPRSLTAIRLTWSDNASVEMGYELTRFQDGRDPVVIPLAVGTTSYLDKGLTRSTAYTYSLVALGLASVGNSPAISILASPLAGLPKPSFTVRRLSSIDDYDGFEIYVRRGSTDRVFYDLRYRLMGTQDEWTYNFGGQRLPGRVVDLDYLQVSGHFADGTMEFQLRSVLAYGLGSCQAADPITSECIVSPWSDLVTASTTK